MEHLALHIGALKQQHCRYTCNAMVHFKRVLVHWHWSGHTPAELRLCALLAIRAGCKERPRWCWSTIYSDRQKLHKGKSVAARTGSWWHTAALSGTLLIENTFDRKLGHFWSKTGTLLIENWDTFDWNQGHPAVKIGAFDQGNGDTKCTTYFICFWHPQNRFCQSFDSFQTFEPSVMV